MRETSYFVIIGVLVINGSDTCLSTKGFSTLPKGLANRAYCVEGFPTVSKGFLLVVPCRSHGCTSVWKSKEVTCKRHFNAQIRSSN